MQRRDDGAGLAWTAGCRALLLFVFGLLGLSACTAVGPPAGPQVPIDRDSLQAFVLIGRFSVRQEGNAYVGGIHWRHAGDRDELLLSSPLGQAMAEIVSDAGGARLIASDGRSQSAATVDSLLQAVLGYPLPLDRLVDWLRGRHANAGTLTMDPQGRPLHLRQEDWRIDYAYEGDDPQALPNRLFIERIERESSFELRLRIDEWQALPPVD